MVVESSKIFWPLTQTVIVSSLPPMNSTRRSAADSSSVTA